MVSIKSTLVLFCAAFIFDSIIAQPNKTIAHGSSAHVYYEENKKQWPSHVLYKGFLPEGVVFLESDKFVFGTYSTEDLNRIHDKKSKAKSSEEVDQIRNEKIRCHAWYVNFEGCNKNAGMTAMGKEEAYSNYFIGSDASRWAGNVGRYGRVQYNGLYDNIDLLVHSDQENFKYDFLVSPGGDVSKIQLRYEGATPLLQKNGTLLLKLNTGDIVEQNPIAWQPDGTRKIPVSCVFQVKNQVITFAFPKGYDSNLPLIIDPVLVGATYSGSTQTCYGHCATFDNLGNIYGGCICFGPGYPATTGAYSVTFGGGALDVAVSKFDPTASSLIYATYIGGSQEEYVQSMFVSNNGELYIYGSVNSTDYPTTATAYDATYNGGPQDIFISQFDATGSSLLGSTYMGGSQVEGIDVTANGHQERGEIIVDANGTAYIASFSSSSDFPVTAGVAQATKAGGQDGVVFALSSGLSTLNFSTFIGGSSDDGARGLRISAITGDIFITGTTKSNDFPSASWAYQATYNGGQSDGYIVHFNNNASAIASCTFFGTAGADQSYFIDIDNTDDVYIYGEAGGSGAPITPGVYSNAGPMFVAKFDEFFFGLIYSTQIGSGSVSGQALDPTAFMVDICENVYIAGFGGTSYPTTANALYTNPNTANGDCYLGVLSRDAISLSYGTLFGGYHVDGGTSRFDPKGIVYHAVCQGGNGFPTTNGSYAPNLSSPAIGWDLAVFKIDFQQLGVIADFTINTTATTLTGCAPLNANFNNLSLGVDFIWDFGDGSPLDTATSPAHIYTDTGTYSVRLVAIDSGACITRDTAWMTVTIIPSPVVDLGLDTTFCAIVSAYTLDAGNAGSSYLWSTGAITKTITPTTSGIYSVLVDNGACTDQDSVVLSVILPPTPMTDSSVCQGMQQQFTVAAGQSWLWNTGATTQSILVNQQGNYFVTINDSGCTFYDTVALTVNPYPVVDLGNDSIFCMPELFVLDAGNAGAIYDWSTGDSTQQIQVSQNSLITVDVTALNCTTRDSISLFWTEQPVLSSDINLCDILSVTLDPGDYPPGSTYNWNTGATTPTIDVSQPGIYTVAINSGACTLQDTVELTGIPGGGALYIPNSFTPNADGINEEFKIYGDGIITFKMRIYDRWGLLIYETNDINKGWDGRFGGNYVQQDTYVCIMDYQTFCNKDLPARKISHLTVLGTRN